MTGLLFSLSVVLWPQIIVRLCIIINWSLASCDSHERQRWEDTHCPPLPFSMSPSLPLSLRSKELTERWWVCPFSCCEWRDRLSYPSTLPVAKTEASEVDAGCHRWHLYTPPPHTPEIIYFPNIHSFIFPLTFRRRLLFSGDDFDFSFSPAYSSRVCSLLREGVNLWLK